MKVFVTAYTEVLRSYRAFVSIFRVWQERLRHAYRLPNTHSPLLPDNFRYI